MKNRKRELLEYVQTLHNRDSAKASRTGMTFWAVTIASVYMAWELFSLSSTLFYQGYNKLHLYNSFPQVMLIVGSLFFLIQIGAISRGKGKLDYRSIRKEPKLIATLYIFIFFMGSPLLLSYLALSSDASQSFFAAQTKINFWILLIVLIALISYPLSRHFAKEPYDLPPPHTIVSTTTKLENVVAFVFSLICLELFLGNSINAIANIQKVGHYIDSLKFSGNAVLLMFAILYLYTISRMEDNLNVLAKIERDIILHKISNKEINRRIAEEYHGKYLGEIAEDLLTRIRKKESDIEVLIDSISNYTYRIDTDDLEAIGESTEKIDTYLTELESEEKEYNKLVGPLVVWLEKVINLAIQQKDENILSITKPIVSDLTISNKNVGDKIRSTIQEIRVWLDLIRKGRDSNTHSI